MNKVLQEALWPASGAGLWMKRAALVAFGVAAMAAAAKIKVPMWPSPVPVTMGTFAALSIGAAYAARLGLVTMLGYLLIGALGFDVFAASSGQTQGLAYMLGGSGGYLVGYALAAGLLGALAARGWDRSPARMGLAMLIGNIAIYVPGLLWLHGFTEGWAQTLEWGLTPFLIGDALKLGLAAMLFPLIWKAVGDARA